MKKIKDKLKRKGSIPVIAPFIACFIIAIIGFIYGLIMSFM